MRLVASFLRDGNQSHRYTKVSAEEISEESEILFTEVKLQLSTLLKESNVLPEIMLNSVKLGYVDPPFAPHRSCAKQFRALRAANGSIRVCKDFAGRCSGAFTLREYSILKKEWKNSSADAIAQDIKFPDIDKLSL